ncbi:MAG: hypothetical protein LBP58_05980 [Azoarcus sp.]|nr:hypothetical protein [Azoarcus sp.]
MSLEEYITIAAQKTGGQKKLSEYINVEPTSITNAKMQRRGLPAAACVKLAQLINVNPLAVIAASELVTEKEEKNRALWREILRSNGKITAIAAICAAMLMPLQNDAQAAVLKFKNDEHGYAYREHANLRTSFGTQGPEVRILFPRPKILLPLIFRKMKAAHGAFAGRFAGCP